MKYFTVLKHILKVLISIFTVHGGNNVATHMYDVNRSQTLDKSVNRVDNRTFVSGKIGKQKYKRQEETKHDTQSD